MITFEATGHMGHLGNKQADVVIESTALASFVIDDTMEKIDLHKYDRKKFERKLNGVLMLILTSFYHYIQPRLRKSRSKRLQAPSLVTPMQHTNEEDTLSMRPTPWHLESAWRT